MKIIKPLALGILTRPFEHAGRFQLGVAALSFIPLGNEPALFADVALWKFLAEELPEDQPIDAAIPKRGAEFLLTAKAFAPAGTKAPAVQVAARFGARTKTLHVFGNRLWLAGDRPSQPEPFAEMAIDWSHAYGGPGSVENPLGKGLVPIVTAQGRGLPLPNIVDPAQGGAAPRPPAGFGPIDVTWQARSRFAGTHDQAWLEQDFPGFARDIDWRFFNCAPTDQQFPEPLVGDESYAFQHLHPTQSLIEGRLPGILPRAFLVRQGSEAMEEIPLVLTTVWFFPHRLRAVLVHHGRAPLAEEDGADVARLMLGADRLGSPRSVDDFRAVMTLRTDKEQGPLHALRDAELVPAELIVPDPAEKASQAEMTSEGLSRLYARRRLEREYAAQRKVIADFGLDPAAVLPPLPPAEPPPTLDDLPALRARLLAEAEQHKALAAQKKAEADARLAALLAGTGIMDSATFVAKRDAKPKGPPQFTAEEPRERLRQGIALFRASGLDPAPFQAMLDDPRNNATWEQAAAQIRDVYRRSAHTQDPADPADASRSAELRRQLAAGATPGDLVGADLSGLDLSGRNLEGVWLDGADLRGANLTEARLANAVLAHARLDGATLDRADLTGANLGRARLAGTSLRLADLRGANLTGAVLERTAMEGVNLAGLLLSETEFHDVDLSGARATGAIFMRLQLDGVIAQGATFDRAQFIDCDLGRARFARSSFFRCGFLGCRLGGADFTEAVLHRAVFVKDCDLAGARFERANLTETNLRGLGLTGADFSHAVLDRADLSRCELFGARLTKVRAIAAQFVAAAMEGADLSHGNFMQASLARADLRGANLADSCLVEADMARVRINQASRTDRIRTTRMRFLPRYRAPAP